MSINRVAVIGAGVMGGGIAAQAANAGLEVMLLDVDKLLNHSDMTDAIGMAFERDDQGTV